MLHRNQTTITFLGVLALLVALTLLAPRATAQDGGETVTETGPGSPLHPTFPLLDGDGEQVQESGAPVSTMNTCGGCHDADFIVEHSFHADLGLSDIREPGATESGRPWDSSNGLFGRWNPITYRYLSPLNDDYPDLTTPEWLQTLGARHAGGGPAVYSREGTPLVELTPDPNNLETSIIDPETGERVAWDWAESGVVEMNCFLCHTPDPNNEARVEMLEAGEFGWANTATLLGSGIVTRTNGVWQWNETAFDDTGELVPEMVTVQDPTDQNCSQCHGLVHVDAQTPLMMSGCSPEQWSTITTGQIVSPQRLSNSGMNLSDKNDLSRSWDIHAERVVSCTDCHYSLNNPVYYRENDPDRPDHLIFDPRRIDLGEYLYRPLHQFAKGDSAQGTLAPEFDDTLRRCESCHSIENSHDWLPYKEKHTNVLSCESCHVPRMFATARQYMDWTVLRADGSPESACRGIVDADDYSIESLIMGYEPVLLPRDNGEGDSELAPHNLITSWFWIYGEPARPVPYRDLQAVWLEGDGYAPDVVAVFDENDDGRLSDDELIIDNEAKESFIVERLAARGLDNPRIEAEIQPYSIHHDVAHGDWAAKDCQSCHSEDSRLAQPFSLAPHQPGGVTPTFVQDSNVAFNGELVSDADGALFYQPNPEDAGLYVLGHDAVAWIDLAGSLLFLGVLLGVTVHGGLRYYFTRRRADRAEPELREVYMYSVYERLWHWLQTAVILLLIFTGLIIHKPDTFGIFSFQYVVIVHNVLAFILVVNAALSLFYHLASGEIQHYLPRPYGFFDQAIEQTLFYVKGIFHGEEHPFEKTRERKLNPLQQVTYFGILNVLLPLQVITGILMWGAQRWPDLAARLGGLPFLAPFHTLIAWLFAAFIVMHVYLTTTGPTPLAGIKAMMLGWDEVEVHGGESTREEAYSTD